MNLPSNRSTFSTLRIKLTCVLLVCACGCLFAQSYYRSTARPKAEIDTLLPFDIELLASRGLPDTALTNSSDVIGEHLNKRPVVLLFWLTTCGPCRSELAELEKLLPLWKADFDFAFLPISIDFSKRRNAFHERAASYPWVSYLDVNREFLSVMPGNLNGVPQIFVFDEAGKQIFHRRKYRAGDLEALQKVLSQQ